MRIIWKGFKMTQLRTNGMLVFLLDFQAKSDFPPFFYWSNWYCSALTSCLHHEALCSRANLGLHPNWTLIVCEWPYCKKGCWNNNIWAFHYLTTNPPSDRSWRPINAWLLFNKHLLITKSVSTKISSSSTPLDYHLKNSAHYLPALNMRRWFWLPEASVFLTSALM